MVHSGEWNNPELRWALAQMYEHHLAFNSRVNMIEGMDV